jgi:cellulose synthase/poly-beta-1,6-N-acetylglucosamine synthase-like glycosyltransferase
MMNKFRQPLMLLTLVICAIYLVYRGLYTLNLESPYAVFASLILYLAEVWGCVSLALFFLQVWDVKEPPEQPVLEGRTVDVFVPTYNEDVQMLRGTLQACVAMEYPHRTFVLDDGRRAEVKALADELGVIYIARDNNLHAKAGNMNNALEQTDGEFVIIFDADHVPARHFIKRLIGYFRDEELAMVQTPHAFYNFDTFQGVVDYDKGRFWDEGQLFYKVLQPGKNRTNSVIFAGSAAMFRRRALKEVGYIAVQTITEDMHTGMKIAAKGWKSLYVSERMIAGQGASDVTTFHTQRLRWGEGNLSILAYDNPLFMQGLSLQQRLSYLASIIHWAGGIPKMAIYATPLLMLFTGVAPVRDFTWTMGAIFAAYMLSIVLVMKQTTAGHGSMAHVEFFNMASFWTQTRSTWRAMFGRRKSKFVVTNKRGRQKASLLPLVGPQIFLIGLSFVALAWGWAMQIFFKDSIDWLGLGISSGLVLFHAKVALDYVRRAMTPASRRFGYRHMIGLPVRWEYTDGEGATRSGWGVTSDLNEQGAGLIAYAPLPSAGEARFQIMANGNAVQALGKIRFSERRVGFADGKGPQCFRHGIEFSETDDATRDALHRIAMEYAVPMWFARFESDAPRRGFGLGRERAKRETDRPEFNLPVILSSGCAPGTRSRWTCAQAACAACCSNHRRVSTSLTSRSPRPWDSSVARRVSCALSRCRWAELRCGTARCSSPSSKARAAASSNRCSPTVSAVRCHRPCVPSVACARSRCWPRRLPQRSAHWHSHPSSMVCSVRPTRMRWPCVSTSSARLLNPMAKSSHASIARRWRPPYPTSSASCC